MSRSTGISEYGVNKIEIVDKVNATSERPKSSICPPKTKPKALSQRSSKLCKTKLDPQLGKMDGFQY